MRLMAYLKKAKKLATLPEMRVFWYLLPVVILIFLGGITYFPVPLAVANGILLLALGGAVFWAISRTAFVGQEAVSEKNQLKSIIRAMEDGLVIYDSDMTISFMNPAAEKIFGLQKENIVGNSISPKDIETKGLTRFIQTMFPTLAPSMRTKSKTGEYPKITDITFSDPFQELRVITSPIASNNSGVGGFMKIIKDRTRESALLKSKDEFITVASHQLRTPITNLRWTLESLSSLPDLPPEVLEIIKNGLASSEQLNRVVEDLLSVSKMEEGRFGYEFQEIDLAEYVKKILEESMPEANRLGITLYFDPPKEVIPAVFIDVQKFAMALLNILDNSIRYNTKNGKVTVKIEKTPNKPFVDLEIKDTGIGVPPDEINNLFKKFFRGSNAVKSSANGSGLGLYIARNIINAHGGNIWAESQLGRGTTFHIELPTDTSMIPTKEVPLYIS